MDIPPEIASWLAWRIDEYAKDEAEPEYLRALASQHSVLPLYIGWTAFWGLRRDGVILLVDTEDGQEPIMEYDARHQRIALFQGARKYRELQPLFPRRPESADDCPHCLGTGTINVEGVEPGAIVCYCGGCGWLA